MEVLRQEIVAGCQAFFPSWYQQEVGKIVQRRPETMQAAGRDNLVRLGDEVLALAGATPAIVRQTIAGDSVWIHSARHPEQSRLDGIAALSRTPGDPTSPWLSEAVQVAAGRILPVVERYGFQVAPPPGHRPGVDLWAPRPYPFPVALPEAVVDAARSYVQAACELRAALSDLAAAKQARLQAEAAGLWARGGRTGGTEGKR
jgi:hypothetical protein